MNYFDTLSNGKKYKLLIVDDEPIYLTSIAEAISSSDSQIEVLQALTAKTGLDIVNSEQPDIIIADWDMPEMNGIEFIQALKSNPKTKAIPIIMCTGIMNNSEHLKVAFDAGAADYIRKPVDKIEIIARVRSILQLSKSYQEIKGLNEAKNKLFSIIAHDLKNPFNSMINFSRILVERYDEFEKEDIVKYIGIMHDSSLQGYKLLENLLDWSRSQLNMISYTPKSLPLKSLCNNTLLLLKPSCDAKKINVNNKISSNLNCIIDENMTSTILRNLISNAIKYSHNSSKITISAVKKGKLAEICIADEGIGMSQAQITNLFSIDKKSINFGTNNESGSGLGLFICKDFIEKQNGSIAITSEEGKGCKVCFTLPLN